MITPAHLVIETVRYVATFGLGLWDVTNGRLASEGLLVRVFPLAGERLLSPLTASATASGVFVANGLPGLDAFEAGDEDFTSASPPALPFLVEVRDGFGRFTPFVMHVDLPTPNRYVLPPCVAELWPLEAEASPPSSPPVPPQYVPLFSSPARPVRAGMTAVRATLIDAETRAPAEFAVLEVRESERLIARGIADARGEVAAMFTYPEPAAPPPSSPLGVPPGQPLAQQEWRLDIAVRYQRDLPRYRLDPPLDPAGGPLADICAMLQQPEATITTTSPPATLTEATLRYGGELVLGAEAGAELFISPA